MTITEETKSWSEMLTPYDAVTIAGYVARTKSWLLKSGGVMAVRQAEIHGDMVLLCGREVVSGQVSCASVPASEIAARAA